MDLYKDAKIRADQQIAARIPQNGAKILVLGEHQSRAVVAKAEQTDSGRMHHLKHPLIVQNQFFNCIDLVFCVQSQNFLFPLNVPHFDVVILVDAPVTGSLPVEVVPVVAQNEAFDLVFVSRECGFDGFVIAAILDEVFGFAEK